MYKIIKYKKIKLDAVLYRKLRDFHNSKDIKNHLFYMDDLCIQERLYGYVDGVFSCSSGVKGLMLADFLRDCIELTFNEKYYKHENNQLR